MIAREVAPRWPRSVGLAIGLGLILSGLLLAARGAGGGGTRLLLVLFVLPVLVSTSPAFAIGLFLVFAGTVLLLAARARIPASSGPGAPAAPGPTPSRGVGGRFGALVLLGPVPIVFGDAKLSRRARWGLAALGAVFLVWFVLVAFTA